MLPLSKNASIHAGQLSSKLETIMIMVTKTKRAILFFHLL